MKKTFTPEVKIALVAVLGIIIMFFGMKFLKGLNLFSSDVAYTMQFDQVNGLSPATPIFANGYKVGAVKDIIYDFDNPQKGITVSANIDKSMRIPEDTRAEIVSNLMGDVQVNLILGNSAQYLPEGSVISGALNNGAMGEIKAFIPQVQKMIPKLDSILMNVNNLLSDPAMASTLHNANKISADLTTSSKQLNTLLYQLNSTLPTMAGKTNLLLDNANGVMVGAKAGMADARSAVQGANTLMATLNNKVEALEVQATVNKLNAALENVNELTAKLNSNKGTAGLLLNDPTLYNNLNNVIRNVDSLVVNLKAHPKRYVHFSLFGKKDK